MDLAWISVGALIIAVTLSMVTTINVGIVCLAILASFLLNLASRRATLRQINASLLEISQQLKELKQVSPPK